MWVAEPDRQSVTTYRRGQAPQIFGPDRNADSPGHHSGVSGFGGRPVPGLNSTATVLHFRVAHVSIALHDRHRPGSARAAPDREQDVLGCGTEFGLPPNTQTDPVSLGLPGCLPVMNGKAFELALKTALALNCEIAAVHQVGPQELLLSRPAQELPDQPVRPAVQPRRLAGDPGRQKDGSGGSAHPRPPGRGHRQDCTTNGRGGDSKVDLNRAGIPLLEIVTEPDLRSPEDAKACLEELRLTLRYLGVSDCEMQEGSLRCDANVNLHIDADGRRSRRRSSRSRT